MPKTATIKLSDEFGKSTFWGSPDGKRVKDFVSAKRRYRSRWGESEAACIRWFDELTSMGIAKKNKLGFYSSTVRRRGIYWAARSIAKMIKMLFIEAPLYQFGLKKRIKFVK